MFSNDRSHKYGWGALRLTTLAIACTNYFDPNLQIVGLKYRWLSFVLQGAIGAIVNVNIVSPTCNIGLLLVCGIAIGFDLRHDATMAIYLFKTLGGDFIAGKLDTLEWKISGIFAFIVATLCAILSDTVAKDYGRIFSILFLMQVFCEYGDNHWERFKFFRHRYSFELIHTLILFNLPGMRDKELRVILMDLIACAAYRSSNYAIIRLRKLFASDFFISMPRMILYHIRGYMHGFEVLYVRDPDLAVSVMKHSNSKGYVLERVLSCPAWSPVYSLESIDGTLWGEMRRDFTILLKTLPGPEKLKIITKKHLDVLISNKETIDANSVALVTMKVFVEYLFERDWESAFDTLVTASWEWRKEIAARGAADEEIKRQAIEVTISLIRQSSLWPLFGEKWTQPRYYSLLLQPFLISPTINTGDLMVAFAHHPELDVCDAMRQMHPFPIFERFLTKDLVVEGNAIATTISTSTSTSTSTAGLSSTPQSSGCPFSMRYTNKINDNRNNNDNTDNCDSNSSEIDGNSTSNPHVSLLPPKNMKQSTPYSSSSVNTTHNNDPVPVPVPVSNGVSGSQVRVLIKANTQVVMFPSDWRDHKSWPVFGAGKRSCPGAHLALPFLTQFREAMVRVKEEENKEEYDNGKGKDDAMKDAKDGKKRKESRFQPERNHLYSGRNNDNKGNISELYYFFTKIIPKLLFTPKLGDGEVCFD